MPIREINDDPLQDGQLDVIGIALVVGVLRVDITEIGHDFLTFFPKFMLLFEPSRIDQGPALPDPGPRVLPVIGPDLPCVVTFGPCLLPPPFGLCDTGFSYVYVKVFGVALARPKVATFTETVPAVVTVEWGIVYVTEVALT